MKAKRIIWLVAAALPCVAFAEEEVYDFENEAVSETETAVKQSQHFIFTLTGDGDTDNLAWEIKQDGGAPSGKKVLAILKADAVDTCFPIVLLKGKKYQDFDMSVKFKIVGGTVNQAAGLMFRAVDVDHSYFVRASAIDNSLVLMRVKKKERTKLNSAKISVGVNRWNSLRVTTHGSEMIVYFNDSKVLTTKDDIYPLGKVGMLTQADSSTYFDDFKIVTP
jgi:hypothetical protein